MIKISHCHETEFVSRIMTKSASEVLYMSPLHWQCHETSFLRYLILHTIYIKKMRDEYFTLALCNIISHCGLKQNQESMNRNDMLHQYTEIQSSAISSERLLGEQYVNISSLQIPLTDCKSSSFNTVTHTSLLSFKNSLLYADRRCLTNSKM